MLDEVVEEVACRWCGTAARWSRSPRTRPPRPPTPRPRGAGPLNQGEVALLRPALEAAFVVARAGLEVVPPVPPPASLRPFLSFRKLSGRALERARRVLDDDDAFRERVRDAVDRDDVGEAGWLLLDRPPGWEERLAELLDDAGREADQAGTAEDVARLTRELARAIEERDEAMDATRQARSDQDRAARALDDARAGREAAELRVAALRGRGRRAAGPTGRGRARPQGPRGPGQRPARRPQGRAGRPRHRPARGRRAPGRPGRRHRHRHEAAHRAAEVVPDGPVGGPEPDAPSVAVGSSLDRDALSALVARAAEAAALLSSSLAEAAELVRPDGRRCRRPGRRGRARAPSRSRLPSPRRGASDRRGVSRSPSPSVSSTTPPRPRSTSCGREGTTLAVDGYNVSLAGWPTLALSAQRRRLVDALEALAARTGCSVVVVFDGADVGAGLPGESRPRGVQVRFTAPGVEADDELLALLDALPVDRPVTVASSDRRVADGARRRGASVISGPQLLAVLDA